MSAPARPTKRPRREPSEEQKAAAEKRRAQLIARSGPIQAAQKMSVLPYAFFHTVNAALQFEYACETKQVVWHTFGDWRDLGWRVKKGESGFAIWSAPQKGTDGGNSDGSGSASADASGDGGGEASSSGRSYFRICYLFHAGQVEPIPGEIQSDLEPTIDVQAIENALSELIASMTPIEKTS